MDFLLTVRAEAQPIELRRSFVRWVDVVLRGRPRKDALRRRLREIWDNPDFQGRFEPGTSKRAREGALVEKLWCEHREDWPKDWPGLTHSKYPDDISASKRNRARDRARKYLD